MKITKTVMAGSLESNDLLVTLRPGESTTLEIHIESIVGNHYGSRIELIARDVLQKYNIQEGYVHIQDRGALDSVIAARLDTAIKREKGETDNA